jgi:WD40 repeat protein
MADHEDMIHAVACCKTWLATASHDKTVVVRRRDGTVHRKLEGHTGGVLAVAFTSDGGLLASAGEDRTIRLWEPENGRLIRTIVNHGDRVGALAWSPDGKVLASGSRDRTVRIWQPDIGRLVRIVRGHEGEVTDLTWDDLGLATACSDGKVRLIDGGSDAILRTLDAGTWTGSVALTPAEILAGAAELVRWKR